MTNESGTQGSVTPAGHYFSPDPQVQSAPSQVELALPDIKLTLGTDRGVFAGQAVDYGTKLLLLDGPEAVETDSVLVDVGAGYGPIALALASRNRNATVYAVEINSRARELCAANARAAGLDNVKVLAPEDFPPNLKIDRIWSNPPIRIGKKALHELLTLWLSRLGSEGSAHLVVQKHLGSDSLASWLETQGYGVVRRGSRKAFRLFDVSPNK